MYPLERMGLSNPMLAKAYEFMVIKHAGQKRKYNGNPYFVHPVQVQNTLLGFGITDNNLLCAAFLHDTLEDTNTNFEELMREFNINIACLVNEVSHPVFPNIKNRRERWSYYLDHYKKASKDGRLLKLADRLCILGEFLNDFEILPKDAINFLKDVYLKESKELVNSLRDANMAMAGWIDDTIGFLESDIEELKWKARVTT